MRRTDYSEFIADGEGIYGIGLGSSFSVEHETGIGGLRRKFGVDRNRLGIKGRMITRIPRGLLFETLQHGTGLLSLLRIRSKTTSSLLVYSPYIEGDQIPPNLIEELNIPHNRVIVCAWENRTYDGDFGIHVRGKYGEDLERIFSAFNRYDIVLSGARIFDVKPGFAIVIASRVPEEIAKIWYEQDVDRMRLREAAEATGIEEYLREAGMTWIALLPRWRDNEKREVVFYLNPFHQDIYNSGLYTVEELKSWAEGKGPVMK